MTKKGIITSIRGKLNLSKKKEEDFVPMQEIQKENTSIYNSSMIKARLAVSLSDNNALFSNEEKKKLTLQRYIDEVMDPDIEPNGTFLYDNETLGDLFTKVVNADGYKEIETQEKLMYLSVSKALQQYFLPKQAENEVKNIIIYGPGDGKKDVTILRCIDHTLSILENKNIIPVDINTNFVDTAGEVIKDTAKKRGINITASGIKDDFRTAKNLNTNKPEGRLYLFFGGSIGNFSTEDMVSTIENMKSDKIEGSRHSIMTVFFAPEKTYSQETAKHVHNSRRILNPDTLDRTQEYNADIQKLITQYSGKEIEQWIMTGFQKLGIDINNLSFYVTYEENTHDNGGRILVGAKVIKPFRIQNNLHVYEKNIGDTIRAIQSKRFDAKTFKKLIQENTRHNVIDISHTDQGVGVVVLESPKDNPENLSHEAKKIKSRDLQQSIFLTISLLSALFLGKNLVEQYVANQENKKIKQQSAEVTTIKTRDKEIDPSVYSISNSKDINQELENFKETIVNNITMRYGVNSGDKDELSFFVRDIIDNNENIRKWDIIGYDGFRGDNQHTVNDFVDEYIIKKYPRLLAKYGVSQVPYTDMVKYKKAMIETVLLEEKVPSISEKRFDEYKTVVSRFGTFTRGSRIGVIKGLGGNTVPNLVEVSPSFNWGIKKYILAKNDRDATDSFNLRLGQEASLAILCQQYKCINQIANIMYIYGLNNNPKGIVKKLVEVYGDIPEDMAQKDAHSFIRKHFSGIYTTIKNDISDCIYPPQEQIRIPYISGDESATEEKRLGFTEIGKYETKEGEQFIIGKVEVSGKKYLIAQRFPLQNLHLYSLEDGKKIMDDIMSIKN